MVGWLRPPPDILKINVSGYSNSNFNRVSSLSSIGCVMRSRTGYWFCSYYGLVSSEDQVYIDLLSIYYGYKMADEEDARLIELESDSEITVNLVRSRILNSEYSVPLNEIRRQRDLASPNCVLRHVERSSNCMAISLAIYSVEARLSITKSNFCPDDLFPTLAADWVYSE